MSDDDCYCDENGYDDYCHDDYCCGDAHHDYCDVSGESHLKNDDVHHLNDGNGDDVNVLSCESDENDVCVPHL